MKGSSRTAALENHRPTPAPTAPGRCRTPAPAGAGQASAHPNHTQPARLRFLHAALALTLILSTSGSIARAQGSGDSVVNSKHDLSTFGPGPIRSSSESEVCIFCHAPHNASPAAPLWNRHNPTTYYRIYSSSTTDARIDQPGGPSKACLSCHDGSIAVGLTLNRPVTEPIPLNHPFIPSGPSNLTNDLSDDHPIGLRYDRQLSNRDPQIRAPQLISHAIKLGPRGELECIACHDPHNNELGNFLRITQRQGALCNTCHDMTGWERSAHALSASNVPATVTNGEAPPYRSMSENACNACHVPHSATHPERLLRERPYDLCIGCHDGVSATDILSVRNLRSGHSVGRLRDVHDPTENPLNMRAHVDCVDCHNPHAVRENPLARVPNRSGSDTGLLVPPAMEHVQGVTLSGLVIDKAQFYYEVCFRCHADNPVPLRDRIVRQRDNDANIRRQFLPTAASAHPITLANRRSDEVPSLLPELRNRRVLSCQDCHNNADARQLGGGSANGPHGSRFPNLLAFRYDTADFTAESARAYALCYECHDRNSILNNESFPVHNQHIVRGRTPCSACHAPHGVSGSRANHSNLINFDLSIVGGERYFVDTGRFAGTCTLTCHGVRHVNFAYGPGVAMP